MSYVYLLHFSQPISSQHTAQHYIGFAEHLPERLQRHSRGSGSRLCEVAWQRGISFKLVRVWSGSRTYERALKNKKAAPAMCPICNPGNRRAAANAIPQEEIENLLLPF